MDQAAVYMSGHNGQYPGSSNGSYRPAPVGVAPPQGSKLATYMNRGGGGGQPGQNYDINNKMNNLSMMNRPPTPGNNREHWEIKYFIENYFRKQLSRRTVQQQTSSDRILGKIFSSQSHIVGSDEADTEDDNDDDSSMDHRAQVGEVVSGDWLLVQE